MDKKTKDKIRVPYYAKQIIHEMVKCYGLGDVLAMLVDVSQTRKDDIDWDADFTLLRSIQGEIKN